jgi:hypothetical protein
MAIVFKFTRQRMAMLVHRDVQNTILKLRFSFMLRWDLGHGFKHEPRRGFIDCPRLLIVSHSLSIASSIVRVRPYYGPAFVISFTHHQFLMDEVWAFGLLVLHVHSRETSCLMKFTELNEMRCETDTQGRKNIIPHRCQKIKCRGADVWKRWENQHGRKN